jgi:hypothetical protein
MVQFWKPMNAEFLPGHLESPYELRLIERGQLASRHLRTSSLMAFVLVGAGISCGTLAARTPTYREYCRTQRRATDVGGIEFSPRASVMMRVPVL